MIDDVLKDAIEGYVQEGYPTGSFLRAVLENDLTEACARADYINIYRIPEIVKYLYNGVPSECWGSPEKVAIWLDKHAQRRMEMPNEN